MVALAVIAIILAALTADYVVQQLPASRRVPAAVTAHASEAPAGIFVGQQHVWLRPEPTGLAYLGTDGLVAALLGTPDRIELHPAGPVMYGEPLATLHRKGRSLTLRSPVAGEIVEQNAGLEPAAIVADPFASGWLLSVRPLELMARLNSMRIGDRLATWSRQEMERLRAFALSRLPESAVGATAADGGPLAPGLISQLDDQAWDEARRILLGTADEETVRETLPARGSVS